MERRYLVAALAIIATFVGVSHGLRSLQCLALKHPVHVSRLRGDSDFGSRAAAKIRTHLRPGYPEEAQLLAEMNVPIASLEAKVAQQMAQRDMAAAQCAQATAMRQAERARQGAMRVRDKVLCAYPNAMPAPISLEANLPDEVNRRVAVNMAALASRLAEQQVRLQIAANKLPAVRVRIAVPDLSVVDPYYDDQVSTSSAIRGRCNHKNSEVERSAGEAARDAMGETE
jgi:pimeloyl-ACP methyl ester carboxylesterase